MARTLAIYTIFTLAHSCACSVAAASDGVGAGSVSWIEVPAPALQGNRLGTPSALRAAVYLPPSYRHQADRRFPVLYLLHGIFDRPEVWVEHFQLPAIADRLIAAGTLPELLVVMPTGSNVLGGGFYRNSPVAGGWGDFIRHDLVRLVDQRFRTLPRRESRAIAGHSMGGFGAVWHALTSADTFSVAYALSPALLAPGTDSSGWAAMLAMGGLAGVDEALARGDFMAVASLAVCTTFLPDPTDEAYRCDPPYRVEQGELLPVLEASDRLRSALPLHVAEDYLPALRSLRGLALDYGLADQFAHIPQATQALSAALAELRVPHDLFVHAGDHRKQIAQRLERIVLPWIGGHLAAAAVPGGDREP